MGFGVGSCAHDSAARVTIKTSVNANLFSIAIFLRAETESKSDKQNSPCQSLKQLGSLYAEQKNRRVTLTHSEWACPPYTPCHVQLAIVIRIREKGIQSDIRSGPGKRAFRRSGY